MSAKKLFVGFLSAIIVFIAFMIILDSTSGKDTNDLLKGTLEDVFTHAHPSAQDNVYERLVTACAGFGSYEEAVDSGNDMCDPEKQEELRGMCRQISALTPEQIAFMGEEKYDEAKTACDMYTPEKVRELCSLNTEEMYSTFDGYCSDFDTKGWTKREAFSSFVMYSMQGSMGDNERIASLQKLAAMTDLTPMMKWIGGGIIVLLTALIVVLLWKEPSEIFRRLGRILIELGLLLIIPLLLVYLYTAMVGVDTTAILDTVNSGQAPGDMGMMLKSIVPLLMKRMYPLAAGVIGMISLVVGIVGWSISRAMSDSQES